MTFTRRDLLLGVPLALAAACVKRAPYDAARFTHAARSAVGLFPAADYSVDFSQVVSRGLVELGVSVKGLRVFLKPNMVEYEAGTIINTDARVVVGAALAMLRSGAREVIVGEGPGHRRDIEYLLVSTGLYDHLRENRIRFIDLNHDDVRTVALASRFTKLTELALPMELLASDFVVSMPKLKTHHWAGLTVSMKNLFGVVPGAVYGWPKNLLHVHGIDASIVDLTATLRPQLAIVDAVVGMEGDGPIMGSPRAVGCVVMGTDLVSVDATCARLIGLDPATVSYLSTASAFLGNLGADRIEQRGERLERYQTRFALPGTSAEVPVRFGA